MLFKDTKTLQDYAEITSAVNFASIKNTLRNVEDWHIVPILGTELYNDLNDAFNGTDPLTDEQTDLLEYCRRVIGPLLCYYHAALAEIKFSDAGLRREETQNSKTAFQYQVTNFREACLRSGENATESLLSFLEENKADYSLWTDSSAFANYRSLFIKTGKEFAELFPSHSPYRNYWAMRSKMKDVEEHNIRAAIGNDLYETLKQKDTATEPDFSDAEDKLLEKLKKAIANFTVAFSIPFLSIRIDTNGITVIAASPSSSKDEQSIRTAAPDNQLSVLIRSCNDAGQAWLKDAIQYIEDNASDFPDYVVPEKTDAADDNSNEDLNGSFIF